VQTRVALTTSARVRSRGRSMALLILIGIASLKADQQAQEYRDGWYDRRRPEVRKTPSVGDVP